MRPRSWWRVVVPALALSCSDRVAAPPGARPAHSPMLAEAGTAASPSVGIGGSYAMPAGGDAITPIPLGPTGLVAPPGAPVRVVIGGAITRQPTPGLLFFCSTVEWQSACNSFWADLVSDAPIPPAGVFGFYGRAFASWDGAAPGSLDGDDELSLSGPAGGEVYAGRAGWQCYYELNVRNPDGTMKYPYDFGPCHTFGGGYVVTVQADDGGGALIVTAAPGQLPAEGGAVTFTAAASDGSDLTDITWQYLPDPTPTAVAALSASSPGLPQPGPAAARQALERGQVWVVGSDGRLSRGRPRQSGIFFLPAPLQPAVPTGPTPAGPRSAPGLAAGASSCEGSATCTEQILATGSMVVQATVNGRPLSASARVQVGSGGGGGSAAELHLSCPAGVERGGEITCEASRTPETAEMVVTGWRFHPDQGEFADIERSTGQDEPTWSGTMATGGTITVTATLDGASKEATAHVAVTDRAPFTVDFQPPSVSDNSDMSERPYAVAGEEGLRHIGHMHPDPHNFRLPGNVDVIAAGPNGGLAYFIASPYEPLWEIHINLSQLQPNSDLAHLQRESAPAFESTVSCLRSQLPSLVAPIAEHEGNTMHPKSHAGRYAAKFNELAGPIIERLVVQQDLRATVDAALDPVIRAAVEESGKADADFRPALCTLTLFPAPR